ncbi:MAG: hypothetical protein FWG53_01840 [Clostridiales bacterium]|nr:hypothetical protein [Clostridiales bacterium]
MYCILYNLRRKTSNYFCHDSCRVFAPPSGSRKEPLILDFGDAFFLDCFARGSGLWAAIDAIGYGNPDTGYYTDDNVRELFERKISFVTRMKANRVVYKEVAAAHLGSLEARENLVDCNGRYVYLKCVPCEVAGRSAYAYLGLDVERKASEAQKLFRQTKGKNMDAGQVAGAMQGKGVFVLVASRRIAKDKLLLTFIATAAIKQLQNALAKSSITPISLFLDLRNHKCKVFGDKIITQEVFKKANDCYKLFNIQCPTVIPR